MRLTKSSLVLISSLKIFFLYFSWPFYDSQKCLVSPAVHCQFMPYFEPLKRFCRGSDGILKIKERIVVWFIHYLRFYYWCPNLLNHFPLECISRILPVVASATGWWNKKSFFFHKYQEHIYLAPCIKRKQHPRTKLPILALKRICQEINAIINASKNQCIGNCWHALVLANIIQQAKFQDYLYAKRLSFVLFSLNLSPSLYDT